MNKTKRFRIGDETMDTAQFDFNVLVVLNRMTRRGDWVSHYEIARWMYSRPNGRTFDNVLESLNRSRRSRKARRSSNASVSSFADAWQIVKRAR